MWGSVCTSASDIHLSVPQCMQLYSFKRKIVLILFFCDACLNSSLLTAYERCSTEAEKEKLLSSVRYGKLKRSVDWCWIQIFPFFLHLWNNWFPLMINRRKSLISFKVFVLKCWWCLNFRFNWKWCTHMKFWNIQMHNNFFVFVFFRNLGPALSRTVYQLYCTQGALT